MHQCWSIDPLRILCMSKHSRLTTFPRHSEHMSCSHRLNKSRYRRSSILPMLRGSMYRRGTQCSSSTPLTRTCLLRKRYNTSLPLSTPSLPHIFHRKTLRTPHIVRLCTSNRSRHLRYSTCHPSIYHSSCSLEQRNCLRHMLRRPQSLHRRTIRLDTCYNFLTRPQRTCHLRGLGLGGCGRK